MWRLIVAGFLLGFGGVAGALDYNPFKGPKPIAILIQTNPWLMVIGSDVPRVALYEDGQLIYLVKEKGASAHYLYKQFTEAELLAVKGRLASCGDWHNCKDYYDLVPGTDQPETQIYMDIDGQQIVTRIYGLTTTGASLPAFRATGGEHWSDTLPESLVRLHEYLTQLDCADAKEWIPQYVEVMIWPYDNAPDTSIQWPAEWPGVDSEDAIARGESYSIFMPGDKINDLRRFLATRKDHGAVEISGRKWSVSLRYVFPSEPVWWTAFQQK